MLPINIRVSSLRQEDEQTSRPKSILLTKSRQQQQAGLKPARVKPKAFSPNKAAKHRGKII